MHAAVISCGAVRGLNMLFHTAGAQSVQQKSLWIQFCRHKLWAFSCPVIYKAMTVRGG